MRKKIYLATLSLVAFITPTARSENLCSTAQRIAAFAGRKEIATQADALLSKLVSAKSPVIAAWMTKRNLNSSSEETLIKEWRSYFAKNFILVKYPNGDAKTNSLMEELVDGILNFALDAPFQQRIEKIFSQTKTAALSTLDGMKLTQKEDLIKRVKAIQLYWPKSLKTARNNSTPLDLIDWGIAYDPSANEINIGIKALAYPNDETFSAVFAHEIGHSFDSCRWSGFLQGPWPFEKIGTCLRSMKSVGAKKRDDSALNKLVQEKKIDQDLAKALELNPTCNKLSYPSNGLQADQLPESFADWFSAEVMAKQKTLDVQKMRTDLCESTELREGSSYPTNADRLRRIYFAHPKFKNATQLGDSTASYCSIEN
jgi:hypothetical protein